jgi:hypothetical protein
MKIRLTKNTEWPKLAICRIIKYNSSYNLRESKDIIDWLCDNIGKTKEINITKEQAQKAMYEFRKNEIEGVEFLFDKERNLNLLKLGIGTEKEYIELLSNYIIMSDVDTIKDILGTLNKDTLIQLCEKVSI